MFSQLPCLGVWQKRRRRTNARALFHEEDCRIIAIADPCEEWDLAGFYYGGKGGRGPVRAEIEEKEKKLGEYGAEKNIIALSDKETTIVEKLGELKFSLT